MKSFFTLKKEKIKCAMGSVLSAVMIFNMLPVEGMAVYASEKTEGLCEHHAEHTAECGYVEAGECVHEHGDECFKPVVKCVHIHTQDCFGESVSGNGPENCTHLCSEESGCITKETDCHHEHDEDCGYTDAQPCTYNCGICTAGDLTDTLADSGRAAAASVSGNLDFSGENPAPGSLDTDGYQWDAGSRTLKLKNVAVSGIVTLPDAAVTIETEGDCSITELSAGDSPDNAQLHFSGTGVLTVEKQIQIFGGNNNAITVAADARVVAGGGISIGAEAGVDSVVTVYGTLTAAGAPFEIGGATYYGSAISAGKVVVAGGGLLNVSGKNGVQLNGMWQGDHYDVTGVFTVEENGCFAANCTEYNVMVTVAVGGGDSFPDGSNTDGAFCIPENYLPTDCGVKLDGGQINLVRKSTGEVYKGALIIHENHDWPDNWNRKDETGHWKECTFEGCDKTNDYGKHSYDSSTWKCACGSTLDVALDNAERLIYDGREKKPAVTIKVDNTVLDTSRYDIVYRNNTNAGDAFVTVKGKDDLSFERTLEFQIARATPTITWNDTVQTVTYSGSPAEIVLPVVTLADGENFNGKINYSYTADGSADYIPGLPTGAGKYSVKAAVEEQDNYTAAEGQTVKIIVEKAEAPVLAKETREYTYEAGSNGAVAIDVSGKLPKDRGETAYTFTTSDENSILSGVSLDGNGILKFTVPGNKSEECTGSIAVTAEMANYEDATFVVEIMLVAKSMVEPGDGSSVSINGSNILTYGQTLSDLTLDSVVFVKQGTDLEVEGTLAWRNGSLVPEAGTTTAEWVFTPKNENQYVELTGTVAIIVKKAVPMVETPAADAVTYSPRGTLDSVGLNSGSATWTVGGNAVEVEGTWSWKDVSAVPSVGNSGYTAVFTPTDSVNYNKAECMVVVPVAKAVPYIAVPPTAAQITYGDALDASGLTSGAVQCSSSDSTEVPGRFTWKDSSIKPAVSDSRSTEYMVVFYPADTTNYSSVETKVTLTVEKAENAPNMPSGAMSVEWECKKVGDVELPADWQWQEACKNTALESGVPAQATAVYIGADKDNYKNVTRDVTITRADCRHENTELRNVVSASCQEKGYSGDTFCLDCGEFLAQGTQTDMTDHSGGTATCVSGRICTVCRTEYTPKDSGIHMHTEIRGQKNATCSLSGYTGDEFCADCNIKISSGTVLPAMGHDWHVTSEKKPTVSAEGMTAYTCSRCGDTYTRSIDRLESISSTPDSRPQSTGLSGNGNGTESADEPASPKTGESIKALEVVLICFMLLLSGCGMFLICRKRKEKSHRSIL